MWRRNGWRASDGFSCEPGFVVEAAGKAQRAGGRKDNGPLVVDSMRLE